MIPEIVYRLLFIITGIDMMAIRLHYQKKVLPQREQTSIEGKPAHLIPGVIAALTTIVFSLEYIIAPRTFGFAYPVNYPDWLRIAGTFMLASGLLLLWSAHHHLDRSFSSFVASSEGQPMVTSGPYHYVRHPIYTAYFLNYLGGGLLASNVILTFIPVLCFIWMVALRIGEEEQLLVDLFGDDYVTYMERTPRFLPSLRMLTRRNNQVNP